MSEEAIKIFYSYSRKDLDMRNTLETHLSTLRRANRISTWHDLQLEAGTEWEPAILNKLDTADIILLLVSSDFIDSEYCYGTELKRAITRHNEGTARVIPIILRPCDWNHSYVPFSKLNVLPTHAKPITRWEDQDEAFAIVAQRIRDTVDQLYAKKPAERQTQEEWEEKPTPEQIIQQVTRKDLQECDSAKILFIKNVKHPEPDIWAYPLEHMRQTESRTFELMWRSGSHGVNLPKAGDLMILHQQAKVTHIVEFLDNQVRKDTNFFRWVRAVWVAEIDWNQLPHQKDILGFSPNYSDGNTHSLNSPNFPRFREAWSSLEEFQKHIFKRLTQSETIITDEDDLTSEKGVDYIRLRDLLKAGHWKEADQETADRMCKVMGRQDEGNLREEDVQNFPCRDLRTINLLWVKYSNNRFGFSVQRQIWQDIETTGQSGYNAYCSFGDSVGWRSPDGWKSYDEITFSLESPRGNLPWWGKQVTWIFGASVGPYLSARVDICKISE
ncbi:MAG: GUN4 domain-containing protein [Lyngbya sp. HA4199-MV5]|nr:GUN4 domain-containing protein [Lyngbya sp. HA4199-MV5]